MACLQSTFNQTYKDYEIIVVDSSNDRTIDILKEFNGIRLIHLDKKTDPGKGRNIGIKEAKGDIIAFTDSDCIVEQDWLENIRKAHNNHDIVGGPVKNGYKTLASWASYFSEFSHMIPSKKNKIMEHIPTCNITYKKKIFDKYGSFPENIFPMEDRIFNSRLKSERIVYDPKIRVSHLCIPDLKGFLKKQKNIGFIFAQSILKYHTRNKIWLNPFLLVAFSFGRGLLYTKRVIVSGIYIPVFFLTLPYFLMGLLMFSIGAIEGKNQPQH